MIILSISTSSNICSVAILKNNICIKELNINNNKTHSENLMSLIDTLLKDTNILTSDINLLVCDVGPGSFTGIRIGIATIKAIGFALSIPIIDVTSLEGLSYNVSKSSGTICSIIDARNNQVYCGIFDKDYNLLEDYIADDINVVLSSLQKYSNISFVGDASVLHKNIIKSSESNFENVIHAKNIGICGYNKFLLGNIKNADTILPMYLRKSQAERIKNSNE